MPDRREVGIREKIRGVHDDANHSAKPKDVMNRKDGNLNEQVM